MLTKRAPYRNRKLLQAADGQPCSRCGRYKPGEVVAAHYSGRYALKLGKGMGQKAHDFCVADLCYACHKYFDGYEMDNDDSRAVEFMLCILETIYNRMQRGVIK